MKMMAPRQWLLNSRAFTSYCCISLMCKLIWSRLHKARSTSTMIHLLLVSLLTQYGRSRSKSTFKNTMRLLMTFYGPTVLAAKSRLTIWAINLLIHSLATSTIMSLIVSPHTITSFLSRPWTLVATARAKNSKSVRISSSLKIKLQNTREEIVSTCSHYCMMHAQIKSLMSMIIALKSKKANASLSHFMTMTQSLVNISKRWTLTMHNNCSMLLTSCESFLSRERSHKSNKTFLASAQQSAKLLMHCFLQVNASAPNTVIR